MQQIRRKREALDAAAGRSVAVGVPEDVKEKQMLYSSVTFVDLPGAVKEPDDKNATKKKKPKRRARRRRRPSVNY